MGMKGSETIIAINTDPNAEIVKYSDYFINADINKAIPAIIDAVKKYRTELAGGKKTKTPSQ